MSSPAITKRMIELHKRKKGKIGETPNLNDKLDITDPFILQLIQAISQRGPLNGQSFG